MSPEDKLDFPVPRLHDNDASPQRPGKSNFPVRGVINTDVDFKNYVDGVLTELPDGRAKPVDIAYKNEMTKRFAEGLSHLNDEMKTLNNNVVTLTKAKEKPLPMDMDAQTRKIALAAGLLNKDNSNYSPDNAFRVLSHELSNRLPKLQHDYRDKLHRLERGPMGKLLKRKEKEKKSLLKKKEKAEKKKREQAIRDKMFKKLHSPLGRLTKTEQEYALKMEAKQKAAQAAAAAAKAQSFLDRGPLGRLAAKEKARKKKAQELMKQKETQEEEAQERREAAFREGHRGPLGRSRKHVSRESLAAARQEEEKAALRIFKLQQEEEISERIHSGKTVGPMGRLTRKLQRVAADKVAHEEELEHVDAEKKQERMHHRGPVGRKQPPPASLADQLESLAETRAKEVVKKILHGLASKLKANGHHKASREIADALLDSSS